MCVCLHLYTYTLCIPDACGDQRRAMGPLEMELEMAVVTWTLESRAILRKISK